MTFFLKESLTFSKKMQLMNARYFFLCSLFLLPSEVINLNFFLMKRLFLLCPRFINYFFFNSATNQLYICVKSAYFLSFFTFLKNFFEFYYNSLVDICAVDFPERSSRFSLFYNLVSVFLNHRLFIYSCVAETSAIPSLSSLYFSANCLEREIWDLFGIFFFKHPDLRRILTDYGFDGFALRKDFPLTGYVEVRFEESNKYIIYEPVELSQEYRFFDFQTPWRPFSV